MQLKKAGSRRVTEANTDWAAAQLSPGLKSRKGDAERHCHWTESTEARKEEGPQPAHRGCWGLTVEEECRAGHERCGRGWRQTEGWRSIRRGFALSSPRPGQQLGQWWWFHVPGPGPGPNGVLSLRDSRACEAIALAQRDTIVGRDSSRGARWGSAPCTREVVLGSSAWLLILEMVKAGSPCSPPRLLSPHLLGVLGQVG